ncbi:MAG: enoyl-CoA hydratase/isomerase family protein [Dehalococcoidales bacterium]|nr:enoyl-CoA hydratase/isomerase family protein [Dehalococcoidales bacterium]
MAVEYEKKDKIAVITLNRPEVLNAINPELKNELNSFILDFRDDPDLWVAVICGAGKSFCVGADIKQSKFGTAKRSETDTFVRPDRIWKPFIAAIQGYCLGAGLELALTCDLRIAAENARFGQPEVNVGVIPAAGGTQRLPRFIPRAKAAELILMGQPIDAQEAYRIGLVNKVVLPEQLITTAMQWAETICQAGPLQVGAAKEAIIRGYDVPLEEGLVIERELHNRITATEDFKEAGRAFVEKRKPNWQGK